MYRERTGGKCDSTPLFRRGCSRIYPAHRRRIRVAEISEADRWSASEHLTGSCVVGGMNNVGKDELLYTGTDWLYSLDSEEPGRRAAAGPGRRARRVARDRTAIRRGAVGNGSRSRTDRDYVVARGEAPCAEGTSARRSKSSAHGRFLHALTCATKPARAASP